MIDYHPNCMSITWQQQVGDVLISKIEIVGYLFTSFLY